MPDVTDAVLDRRQMEALMRRVRRLLPAEESTG